MTGEVIEFIKTEGNKYVFVWIKSDSFGGVFEVWIKGWERFSMFWYKI